MIAKDTGPKPEKAQRGDNTKKVSETEDKACYTGKYLLLLERCLPAPGGSHCDGELNTNGHVF